MKIFLVLCSFLLISLYPAKGQTNATLLQDKEYFKSLKIALPKAKQSIYVSMYLFKIGKKGRNKANQFLKLLVAAKKRGVDVVVRLERSNFNHRLNRSNRYTAKRLKKAGIQVQWDHPKQQSHSKLIIIDQEIIYLGSHNLSHSALAKNQELSITFKDRAKAGQLLQEYFHL